MSGPERLTVVVISAWYPTPEQPMNGVFVREHARAAALHHLVAVVADGGARDDSRPYVLSEAEDEELRTLRLAHRISRIPMATGLAHARGVLAGLRRLRREGLRPDLVHAHVHQVGLAALIAGRRYRVPVVVSEHSSHFSLGTLSPSGRRLARLMFRAADLVCPVSEDLRRRIEDRGVRARFQVVPNPVDTVAFGGAPPPGGPPTALFVGGLQPIKRVDLLLRALARVRHPDLRLEIVGDGPARSDLEGLAHELGLGQAVRFRGYVSKEGVAERMRAASFLVLPSMIETFGLALAEALAVGRPVVASRTGAIPEIVDERNGILVPPGDEEALAGAIERMVDERSRFDWRALSSAAGDRFGLAAVGRRWDEIYRTLVHSSGRMPPASAS